MSQVGLFDSAPPESEHAKGRRIVAELAELPDRKHYLALVRERMRQLYRMRVQLHGEHGAAVRGDDARQYFESLKPPRDMNRNFLAAVWREPGWKVTGKYRSETRNSHGNVLNAYAWTE